ncbi:MAG: hypothetical protein L3J28_02825 [Candidatus Polarisedimenticolaceae bacterium]|nr:hypothetical protein [Candidatus Polarisedimenticolaceae bacterium]
MGGISSLIVLALLWVVYGLIHSLLASEQSKVGFATKWPEAARYYRLLFNASALFLLLPPLYLTYSLAGESVIVWHGAWRWVSHLMAIMVVVGFLWSLRYYDSAEFLGLKQMRENGEGDGDAFVLSPLHHYVRHPWYALALVLIWTRDMDAATLVSAVAITLYFIIGSRFEERSLVRVHGERYREYMRLVAGLIPLPWKVISPEKAAELTRYE